MKKKITLRRIFAGISESDDISDKGILFNFRRGRTEV